MANDNMLEGTGITEAELQEWANYELEGDKGVKKKKKKKKKKEKEKKKQVFWNSSL